MEWNSEKEIYEYIGHFCVEFEQVCRYMEVCIRHILLKKGLTDESVQSILLSDYTAEPLRTLLQKLVGETLAEEKIKKILSKVFNKLQKLIQERNDLIHSKWFIIGINNEIIDKTEVIAVGEKLHANKNGSAIKNFDLKKEKLESLIKKCREASIIISLLTRCAMNIRKVNECCTIENNDLVLHYEALKKV